MSHETMRLERELRGLRQRVDKLEADARRELTCSACERPLSERAADRCVRDATDAEGNVLT